MPRPVTASTRAPAAAAAKPESTQTIMVWPHEDLATVSVVRWRPFSPPGLAIRPSQTEPGSPPHHSSLLPEDEGLAEGLWLPLVQTPAPRDHSQGSWNGKASSHAAGCLPSQLAWVTVIHPNPLPDWETEAGEREHLLPEPLHTCLGSKTGLYPQEENSSSNQTSRVL